MQQSHTYILVVLQEMPFYVQFFFFFFYCFWVSYFFIKTELLKGVLHPWALFLKILCIFSKNKATLDKVSYGSGQKCSKKLKNYSFTSAEAIVVKLE